ncbi:MAG: [Fe-S]-dependent transcriptional repressor FeoC [Klebsiella michiganensis]|nr:[Fe-S]-dependent transcriptional repressor FeoC [Klebsiella michiganensis]
MASLIEVRDMLALQGRMEINQLCNALHLSRPMAYAMLTRMEAMGKAVRIQEEADGCLSGECKQCPEGKSACQREWWSLTGC